MTPLTDIGATYRLQFNQDFTAADAVRILPYLRANGIEDLRRSDLSVSPDDPHYSACGHALIADFLAAAIRRTLP